MATMACGFFPQLVDDGELDSKTDKTYTADKIKIIDLRLLLSNRTSFPERIQKTDSISFKMSQKMILLMSSSKLYGFEYLEHAKDLLKSFLNKKNVKKVLFVPYAGKDHDNYTAIVERALSPWGYQVEGLHAKNNITEALRNAEAIFIGGGNTFVLLKSLYDLNIIDVIRDQVLQKGTPYIGSSAGTNVATCSIHTTNDMPVACPPSFDALNLVPFNINPHYLDPDTNSKHKGETRDERIHEFISYHQKSVLGLREGTSVLVEGSIATLVGNRNAKLFKADQETLELPPKSDLSFLL